MHPAFDDRRNQQHRDRRSDRDPTEHLVNFQQLGLAHLAAMAAGRLADLAGCQQQLGAGQTIFRADRRAALVANNEKVGKNLQLPKIFFAFSQR